MKINLENYEPTGQQERIILQYGLNHVNSVQGHQLHNHLNKIDPKWMQNFIINNNKLITSTQEQQFDLQTLIRPQFVISLNGNLTLHQSIISTRICLNKQTIDYFVEQTGFERVQKKEKSRSRQKKRGEPKQNENEEDEVKKSTTKAFELIAKQEKEKKKRMKMRAIFLKKRIAKIKLEKQKREQLRRENNIQSLQQES